MEEAVPGGPLADLLIGAARFPTDIPRLTPYVAMLIATARRIFSPLITTSPQMFDFALNAVQQINIEYLLTAIATSFAFISYYQRNKDSVINSYKATATEYLLPASQTSFSTTPTITSTSSSSTSSRFPPDSLIPCCPNYDGDIGGGICAGIKTANMAFQGCSCVAEGPPGYQPFTDYQAALSLFNNIPTLTGTMGPSPVANASITRRY